MTEDTIETPRRGRPPKPLEESETEIVAKKGTVPGWRPSTSLLGTLKARNGYTAKWVKYDSGRIAEMRSQGWVIMKPEDNVGDFSQLENDVSAGSSISKEIRYRDMIAMMLSPEGKKQRTEYYRAETASKTKAILRQTDGEMREKGVQTYTPKGMPGRIVID